MLREHLDLLRRIAEEGPAEVSAFVEAVLALSDGPCPENIDQYLVASRELEDMQIKALLASELRCVAPRCLFSKRRTDSR